MDVLRQYILSVTAAAFLCAVIKSIAADKPGQKKILGLVCGIFLLATALRPLGLLQLPGLEDPAGPYRQEAEQAVAQAEEQANAHLEAIITEQTEAYILDKADTLGVRLEVQVEVNEELVPWQVTLQGQVSPYAKSRLGSSIARDLGIPEERQVWSP
ncbi:MAG: hypothetical protein SOY32_08275 [Candidatus Faecousia sp.]|nr:hypothetical protein [Clostridiales bacterium]MDD7651880.1 hypothetical protein [Bacillota bacterium]MDY4220397.1 hypothetical protein [Candidatus Faecousia sp.]